MTYIENPFIVGEYAVCINDSFHVIITTAEDKSAIGHLPMRHPKKGEICCVDEVLGGFIRFDEYDENDPNHPDWGWKWWKHTHFKKLSQQQVEEHYEGVAKKFHNWFDKILQP